MPRRLEGDIQAELANPTQLKGAAPRKAVKGTRKRSSVASRMARGYKRQLGKTPKALIRSTLSQDFPRLQNPMMLRGRR